MTISKQEFLLSLFFIFLTSLRLEGYDCCETASCYQTAPCCCQNVGYDKNGFFIEGDCHRLNMKLLFQPRYIYNHRHNPEYNENSNEYGFQIARANLFFNGYALCPQLRYCLTISQISNPGNASVEEAQILYDFTNDLTFNFGRFRNLAFLREERTSYAKQLAVERSYMNEVFTIDYVEGAGMTWEPIEPLIFRFVVSDGLRSGSTQFRDFDRDLSDFAITSRIDLKVCGDWSQESDFTNDPCSEGFAMFFGAAVHYEKGKRKSYDKLEDFITWTADGSIEGCGWDLYSSVVGRHICWSDHRHLDQYGILVQAAKRVTRKFELFARYEWIDFDGYSDFKDFEPVEDDLLRIVTGGFNYYFYGHSFKLTGNVLYCFDPVPATITATGLLEDALGQKGQIAAVTQLQLFF